MDVDYLIIGQGLAGSLLAWELIRRNRSLIIIDSGRENASRVAAGLINPVTGIRFVKTDAVDALLPIAREVYRNLSDFFSCEFLVTKPMLRLVRTEAEALACRKRLQDPNYRDYLTGLTTPERFGFLLDHPFAALQQQQTGYLLTRPLLSNLKDYFIRLNCFRQTTLDYREIQIRPVLRWRDLKPKQIIFCEGFETLRNPWFSFLPLQPAKGQILTLESDRAPPTALLNYGNWLAPVGNGHFRVGATFERDTVDTSVTEAGKNLLLQALAQISGRLAAASVIDQQAHIRPCTRDRRPFLGRHPRYPELWIFNGFGAKGSLQIPWYSRHLADALLTDAPLSPHCDIKRR